MPQMVTVSNLEFGILLSMPKYNDKCRDLSHILTTSPAVIFCPTYKETNTIRGSAWDQPLHPSNLQMDAWG
jgi:hypothetical protein